MNEFQNLLRRLFTRVLKTSMFNRWMVFGLDLVWCLIGYAVSVYIRSLVDASHFLPNVIGWGLLFVALNAVSFYIFKSYRGLIRHSNFQELWRIFAALTCSCTVFLMLLFVNNASFPYRFFLVLNMLMLTLALMLGSRLIIVFLYSYTMSYTGNQTKNTLV